MSYELSDNAKAALKTVLDAQLLAQGASVSIAQVTAVLSHGNTPKPL